MDSTLTVVPRDQNVIARERFESFKLGGSTPRPSSMSGPSRHSHQRSHSRNTSMSSVHSFQLPATAPQSPVTPSDPVTSTLAPSHAKRNSHHRRRSSVSTRHESAELMGLALPDIPTSSSEDNINLGEKDSIRRRALLALEGKVDVPFTKVEIPELSTPVLEKKLFDLSIKSSFAPPTGMSGKRDSFKMLGSSVSAKDQLQTLVEEEEEEEDAEGIISSASAPVVSVAKQPSSSPSRPKLSRLRPLSLTPESLITHGLPTPSQTPSSSAGHQALSATSSEEDVTIIKPITNHRSYTFPPANHRRSRGSMHSENSSTDERRVRRSISYRNSAGLPTPDSVSSDRRFSASSSSDDDQSFTRPLSTSEQHFLFKSHNALLARITDLERALSNRPTLRSHTRPMSVTSESSGSSSNEPSDEMLQLISDLKAERDELKRDVDGWRRRVADGEKKIEILAERVETERREAWVARSRAGLLEVEKSALEKAYDAKQQDFLVLQGQCHERDDRCKSLEQKIAKETLRADEAEKQIGILTLALVAEKERVAQLERELEAANLLATPTPETYEFQIAAAMARKKGLGFTSVDSGSSATIIDDDGLDGPRVRQSIKLGSVQEEAEHDGFCDEEDALAGYEDEHTDDELYEAEINDDDSDDIPIQIPVPQTTAPGAAHTRKVSLSTWTFPRAAPQTAGTESSDVDRFFGCLQNNEPSSPLGEPIPSYETSKNLFAQGFSVPSEYVFGEIEEPLLSPTPGMGTVLNTINEVEEDVDESVVSLTGITITFTAPGSDTSVVLPLSPEKNETVPIINVPGVEDDDLDDEPIVPFNFGRPLLEEKKSDPPPPVRTPSPVQSSSPSSIPRRKWATTPPSPSSLPRKPTSPAHTNLPASPTVSRNLPTSNAFVTPPSRRGGPTPSLIPTPTSPSPLKKSVPASKIPSPPTFVRQPPKKTSAYDANHAFAMSESSSNRYTSSPSPPAKSSSGLSSPSLAARLFTTFTWSSFVSEEPVLSKPRGYVSKDHQLARLRFALSNNRNADGLDMRCADCTGDLVYL